MTTPQPAEQATRPSTRTLALLAGGHVTVAVAVLVLAVLLLSDGSGAAAPVRPRGVGGVPAALLGVGLAALGLAQVLSIRRLLSHRRALARTRREPGPGGLDDALVAAMFRIGWPVALAQYPLLLGMLRVGFLPPPAPLLTLLCLLPCASLLLDHAHAGWTYRHLDDRGPRTRPLLPGDGERLRKRLRRAPALLVAVSPAAVLLVVLQVAWWPLEDGLLQVLPAVLATASAAAMLLSLAYTVGRLRDSVHNGQIPPAALDAVARPMGRLATLGILGAASLGIAVLTAPTAPLLAAAPVLLLLLALSALTLHLASVTCIKLGNPLPDRSRRAGRR